MEDKFAWFDEARFGMFIHWGPYSCGAKYVWQKYIDRMTTEEYSKYTDHFDPDLYDPRQWAKAAKAAGMKYFVLTAKHHDGYCIFDTKHTDYKYKKSDLLKEAIDAFRAEGLKVGIYYSLIDWHHPEYPHDARHPQRDIPKECDPDRYREFLYDQVREILTNYGRIDLIWFDGSYPDTAHIWDMPRLRALVQELQPGILISRLPGYDDFKTPEQNIPQQGMFNEDGTPAHWEGCQVLHGEWCYMRDQKWKTVPELIQMLIRHASRGGNLLLNVGPTARGLIDKHTVQLLEGMGEWMRWNSKAIYNCHGAPAEFPEPEGCRYTYNKERNTLYLHIFSWPDRRIDLPGLGSKVEYAQLLCDGGEICFTEHMPGNINGPGNPPEGTLRLALPVTSPELPVPVVELFLKK